MGGFPSMEEYAAWLRGMNEAKTAISTAFQEGCTDMADKLADMIVDILPVALPVLGIGIAVFFGVKFIKKVMK